MILHLWRENETEGCPRGGGGGHGLESEEEAGFHLNFVWLLLHLVLRSLLCLHQKGQGIRSSWLCCPTDRSSLLAFHLNGLTS